jgi:hypothetical protein
MASTSGTPLDPAVMSESRASLEGSAAVRGHLWLGGHSMRQKKTVGDLKRQQIVSDIEI